MSENHKKMIFHVHTSSSYDSRISPKSLLGFCKKEKIGVVVVCDHNTVDGAKAVKKLAESDIKVIIGEEISTLDGEIIGLFLTDTIKSKMSIKDTILEIKKQGGLVCLPHPGERIRRSAITKKDAEAIIEDVDIVEVFNSRTIFGADMDWARDLAKKYCKLVIYGSDSHNISELKGAICLIPDFFDVDSFIDSLGNIQLISSKRTGLIRQFFSIALKYYKRMLKLKY